MKPELLFWSLVAAVGLLVYAPFLFRVIFDAYFRAKYSYNCRMLSQMDYDLTKEGDQDNAST